MDRILRLVFFNVYLHGLFYESMTTWIENSINVFTWKAEKLTCTNYLSRHLINFPSAGFPQMSEMSCIYAPYLTGYQILIQFSIWYTETSLFHYRFNVNPINSLNTKRCGNVIKWGEVSWVEIWYDQPPKCVVIIFSCRRKWDSNGLNLQKKAK